MHASKYPYMHMISNETPNTRYNEVHYGSPNKELGFCPLVFQGGAPGGTSGTSYGTGPRR